MWRPLLAQLPPRERTILVLRFFRELAQTQIAEQIGLSQIHVSRVLRQTLSYYKTVGPGHNNLPPRWWFSSGRLASALNHRAGIRSRISCHKNTTNGHRPVPVTTVAIVDLSRQRFEQSSTHMARLSVRP